MSKLGLNHRKLNRDPQPLVQEPPDKKRKMEDNAAQEPAWDDDLDLILTQNMNDLDRMVACSQMVVSTLSAGTVPYSSGVLDDCIKTACHAVVCSDVTLMSSKSVSSNNGKSVATTTTGRLVGRGSAQSRSADYVQCHTNAQGQTVTSAGGDKVRKSSFSGEIVPTHSLSRPVTSASSAVSNCHLKTVNSAAAVSTTSRRDMQTIKSSPCPQLDLTSALAGPGEILADGTGPPQTDIQMSRLAEQCDYYKSELTKLQRTQLAKDGQIKILRDQLHQVQTDLSLQKQEALKRIEQRADERNRREAELERETERMKSELQFKQHEVTELQGCIKKLEKQIQATAAVPASSSSSSLTKLDVARSPSTLRLQGQVESALTASPSKTSLPNSCHTSVVDNDSRHDVTQCLPEKQRLKMKLTLSNSKGRLTGPCLVAKLLQQKSTVRDVPPVSNTLCFANTKSPERQVTQTQLASGPSSETANSPSRCVQTASTRLDAVGLDLLLTSDAGRTRFPASPLVPGLLASENENAVLLLPQIEDVLKGLLQQLRRPGTQSSRGTFGCCTQSLSDGTVDYSLSQVKWSEAAQRSLRRLRLLVNYSRHVRLAIVGCAKVYSEKMEVCGDGNADGSNETKKQEDTTLQGSLIGMAAAQSSHSAMRVMHSCQLLNTLVSTAGLVQEKPSQLTLASTSLEVLTRLAESCDDTSLERFVPLLQGDTLLQCLTDSFPEECDSAVHFSIACNTLTLIRALTRSSVIVRRLCTISHSCLLSAIYTFCSVAYPDGWSIAQLTDLRYFMISIIASVVSSQQDGGYLLLHSDCECSSKVVKDLIIVLGMELEVYSMSNCSRSLLVLRQGLCVLHSLATVADLAGVRTFAARYSGVRSEYLMLMFGVAQLMKRPAIVIPEHEINTVWSLLPDCLAHLATSDECEKVVELDKDMSVTDKFADQSNGSTSTTTA